MGRGTSYKPIDSIFSNHIYLAIYVLTLPLCNFHRNSEPKMTNLTNEYYANYPHEELLRNEHYFITEVADILKQHSAYSKIQIEPTLGTKHRYRPDIIAVKENKKIVIECKTNGSARATIRSAINQLNRYATIIGGCEKIAAFSTVLTDKERKLLENENITPWDPIELAKLITPSPNGITKSSNKFWRTQQASKIGKSREEELLDSLSMCSPGKKDWAIYQKLVGDIFNTLFSGPLGAGITECSDLSGANRRDFILPNQSNKGFWSFIRQRYHADFIVVDAKNYSKKIGKNCVLQMSNYLKSHGTGLFGIIVSRKGGDLKGCAQTIREHWLLHHKLILVLDDEDIKEMLNAKISNNCPEDVLTKKIQDFRLTI